MWLWLWRDGRCHGRRGLHVEAAARRTPETHRRPLGSCLRDLDRRVRPSDRTCGALSHSQDRVVRAVGQQQSRRRDLDGLAHQGLRRELYGRRGPALPWLRESGQHNLGAVGQHRRTTVHDGLHGHRRRRGRRDGRTGGRRGRGGEIGREPRRLGEPHADTTSRKPAAIAAVLDSCWKTVMAATSRPSPRVVTQVRATGHKARPASGPAVRVCRECARCGSSPCPPTGAGARRSPCSSPHRRPAATPRPRAR